MAFTTHENAFQKDSHSQGVEGCTRVAHLNPYPEAHWSPIELVAGWCGFWCNADPPLGALVVLSVCSRSWIEATMLCSICKFILQSYIYIYTEVPLCSTKGFQLFLQPCIARFSLFNFIFKKTFDSFQCTIIQQNSRWDNSPHFVPFKLLFSAMPCAPFLLSIRLGGLLRFCTPAEY